MDAFNRWIAAWPGCFLVLVVVPGIYFPPLLVPTLIIALVASAVKFHQPIGRWTLWVLVFGGLWLLRSVPEPELRWPFAASGSVSGWGTVVAEAPLGRFGAPFELRVDAVQWGDWVGRGRATVVVSGWRESSPAVGSLWTWKGVLLPDGRLRWVAGQAVGWAAPWWKVRADLRLGLRHQLQAWGEGPAALAEALLIGATDDLTPWEKESFRLSGCSHVLALSGMHLSLLALLLTWAIQRRLPPGVAFTLVQALLGAFCFLAGPIPSLLRAWVMAFLAGLWNLLRRPIPLRELLAQSFLVTVLIWPSLVATLSLQLSFLAMAGLFLWAQRWDRGLRPWLGRWGAAQFGSSAAALVATAPLTWMLFGEVRWIGVLMTPVLVALTTVHMAGGGLAAVVGGLGLPLSPAAPVFQVLYQMIFSCTAWAQGFPALSGTLVPLFGVVGGLGAGAWFLYNARRRKIPMPLSLNYDSPASLQAFLDDRGFNALKRWGQNFLINAGARKQILAALDLLPGEPVWEVGPGLGALTHHLVEAGHPLTVFEIDPGYITFLKDEFGSSPAGFQVVEGDVVKTWKSQPLSGMKTVGNLPYNAASAIIADFIEGGFFPEVFVVTVQLEMAQRMTASPGSKNYSSFSILCQAVFRVDDVVTLKPGSFYPAPEVTSRVVRLRPHGFYPGLDHQRFSRFVRECFSSRRKTLRNNLPGAASAIRASDAEVTAAFTSEGIDLGLRAEALTVDQFVAVFRSVMLEVGNRPVHDR